MRLTLVVLALTPLFVTLSCTRKPKTSKDQVSYTIGVQFGRSLRNQKLDVDAKVLARGIADGVNGEKPDLTDEEMQAAMMHLSQDRQQEQKAEADKNKQKSEEFMAKNKSADGIKTTASGLQYKIQDPGSGRSPKLDEVVVVNYKGTLIDGTEFDSSYKRNAPAEFPIKNVIPGWTEGLQLLKKGGKATFYIPPELGYGDRGRQQIPANSVLIFDVELLDMKPAPQMPAGHPVIKK
jgi:FKBP-type peptidyl-prolyl cis-trans isomerase FkpA/FKBP-type peptidyl-prolyl cis-trans isomerase FklB